MDSRQGAIAIFVKTPGYSPLKTRLAASIGQALAEEFHMLSATAVAAVVELVAKQKPVFPHWAVAEATALSDPSWNQFPTLSQGTGNLGARLAHVNQILSAKYDYVIFLGADAPQLPVDYLIQAVDYLSDFTDRPQFVLGPARDGGFYLFGTQMCLSQKTWLNIPYSESNTAEKLLEQIQGQGDVHQLPVLTDVDTVDELELITRQAGVTESILPEQQQVVEWIRQRDSHYS